MAMEFWLYVIPTLLFLALGVLAGGFFERRHLRRLAKREDLSRDIVVTNLKRIPRPETVQQARMVVGGAVIASDYFKTFATGLRKLVGGEMRAAQSLLTRARREATLRMIDDARQQGATEIWNVRYGSCNISQMQGNKGAMAVEVYAYGTAVTRK